MLDKIWEDIKYDITWIAKRTLDYLLLASEIIGLGIIIIFLSLLLLLHILNPLGD